MNSGEETAVRHRQRPQHNGLSILWANYKVELLGVFIASLGAFLLLERLNLRRSIAGWIRAIVSGLFSRFNTFDLELTALLSRLSLSDVVGALLICVALVAVLARLRWRLLNTPRFSANGCPRCAGPLHRVHRKWYDRIINAYVPVRRYRCANSACGWKGLRIGRSEGLWSQRHASEPA